MPRVDNSLFLERMNRLHPRIKVHSKYEAAKIPVECECLECGYCWKARPLNLTFEKSPTGCPQCGGTMKKTHSSFVKELRMLHPELEVLGKYTNAHTPILIKCKEHGTIFEGTPTNLLRRSTSGCKSCLDISPDSKLASELKQYCIAHFPGTIIEYCVVKNPVTERYLPFDIFIPNVNGEDVYCEIMGAQHYEYKPFCHGDKDNYFRQLARDDYKQAYANAHGRYVEIDARRILSVDAALKLIVNDTRSWIAKKAASLQTDGLLSSRTLEYVYQNTESTRGNGMTNVINSSRERLKRPK